MADLDSEPEQGGSGADGRRARTPCCGCDRRVYDAISIKLCAEGIIVSRVILAEVNGYTNTHKKQNPWRKHAKRDME